MSSDTNIGELLDQFDMEYWLDREGVDYQIGYGSSGTQLNVHECPECHDDRWKVYLNADTGLGNCFVCDAKFNKWKFIKAYMGFGGREMIDHVKQIASEIGWVPRNTKAKDVHWNKGELIIPVSYSLPINGKNIRYLSERNIDIKTAQYFNLRYSHDGVFRYWRNEREITQSYAKRVIIPVFDLHGDLVSFQGRDITDTAEKKYLFPPGYASSGKYLYNGHNAIGAERVVVGEGVFDVMATKIALDTQVDLRDVVPVGTFGKHLSHSGGEDQLGVFIELKQHGLKEVTFMWDGSSDAILAAVEAGLLLNSIGLVTRVAILPKDKDPNEVLPEVVCKAFWSAPRLTAATAVRLKISHG